MTQFPILNGIYADGLSELRTSYPRNMVPVPKQSGVSSGFLRPADGIRSMGTGPGLDRGGIFWNGTCMRVMGQYLVSVAVTGQVDILAEVSFGGQVTMDAGFGRLGIWAGGRLFYWDGTLTQVTDPDLGTVIDGCWIDGYFVSTDGNFIIVTELDDPTQVNPLKYGSAESDPDPIVALAVLRNELYALGRYTIDVFDNVGGTGFPFQRIDGAHVPRGVVGTHAYATFLETFAFLGSGFGEAPAIYLMVPGGTQKLSTSEIDRVLRGFSEVQLSTVLVESRIDKGHNWLLIHLPDQTLVYDAAATAALGEPVWYTVDSGTSSKAQYRGRNLVWCYERWIVGDTQSPLVGYMSDTEMTHFDEPVGWEFSTGMLYNEGRGAIVHELELVALPGRVALGVDPTIWTSYSEDGETWSQERSISAGKQGERMKRLAWRKQGHMRNYRMQRFRGTSAARISFMRLEAKIEGLNA